MCWSDPPGDHWQWEMRQDHFGKVFPSFCSIQMHEMSWVARRIATIYSRNMGIELKIVEDRQTLDLDPFYPAICILHHFGWTLVTQSHSQYSEFRTSFPKDPNKYKEYPNSNSTPKPLLWLTTPKATAVGEKSCFFSSWNLPTIRPLCHLPVLVTMLWFVVPAPRLWPKHSGSDTNGCEHTQESPPWCNLQVTRTRIDKDIKKNHPQKKLCFLIRLFSKMSPKKISSQDHHSEKCRCQNIIISQRIFAKIHDNVHRSRSLSQVKG